jgi:hypothetical protein
MDLEYKRKPLNGGLAHRIREATTGITGPVRIPRPVAAIFVEGEQP